MVRPAFELMTHLRSSFQRPPEKDHCGLGVCVYGWVRACVRVYVIVKGTDILKKEFV